MAPRKYVTLTLDQKIEIIKLMENGQNYGMIAEKYGIGKSTVGDIKKNKEKIMKFVSTTERGPGTRKTLKEPENLVLENALFIWFMQQRRRHIPISGEIICEKARLFHREITKQEDGFTASRGWLDNFKHRHGIRRLKITGEKLSCDEASIEPFRNELQRVINENNLDLEQIYNADESGLFWRMLPEHTLTSSHEKNAPGRKMIKARIIFMPCANASGTHKLPLLVIGTAQKPRAFKSVNLPVYYRGQKNAWATRVLFLDWFQKQFVPVVCEHLLNVNLPPKALLLLDNCPGHPSAEELRSDDGNIFAMFLPPNTTALIQPMDQNVIQNIKLNYRKSLLVNVLADPVHGENLIDALKAINLKDAVFSLVNCWKLVQPMLIKKSWKHLLPFQTENKIDEVVEINDIQISTLINQIQKTCTNKMSDSQAQEWACRGADEDLANHEILTDDQILQIAAKEDDIDDEDESGSISISKVSPSEAVNALNTVLQWAEDENMDSTDILLVRRLRELAFEMKIKII
ncbi:jerky protein homolog-like [Sipha flava]|uniref:Jerky protein homolog-like n=1 Tax=Sipha flava TaxID=143950 RepID=A0A8B8F4U3_9HEMI|nr:jerky protein homolog-like [Sipha flava]